MSDQEFREKANAEIRDVGGSKGFQILVGCHPSVILAILSEHSEPRPPLPFFSKIVLRYAFRKLRTCGCKVYIKNIPKAI